MINAKNIIIVLVFFGFPLSVFGGSPYYTLPINVSDPDVSITSWFDHDDTVINKIDYTGSVNFSRNDHYGIDYGTSGVTGKDVLAADSGIVKRVRWENLNDFGQGYGFHVALYHSAQNQCTVYGHLASTTIVAFNDVVDRGDIIGSSGNTGESSGPHLHFGVYSGGSTASSQCLSLYSTDQVDPYGWLGSGSDPRANDEGYLWTTDPPSFSLYNSVSSNISTTTVWRDGQVYVVSGLITVNSGSTLIIKPGVIVKFANSNSGINVSGIVDAEGLLSSPIYFTSINDDSVGGDTNNNGTSTTPSNDDWYRIQVNSNASTTLSHSVVRYAGGYSFPTNSYTNLYNNGGVLEFVNSEISNNSNRGIWHNTGTTTVVDSNVHDIPYAIYTNSGSSGYLDIASSTLHDNWYSITLQGSLESSIVDNNFYNHSGAPLFASLDYGAKFSHSGNIATGTGRKGFVVGGVLGSSQNWDGGLDTYVPYIVDQITIPYGTTLTVGAGTIIKFNNSSSYINNNGILTFSGSSSSPIYLTSINDDSVGGDTNNNGTSTMPYGSDWDTIKINSNSTTTLYNTRVSYGGYGTSHSNIYNNGGRLEITDSEVASSSSKGIYQVDGDTIISGTNIHNQNYGIRFSGGNSLTVDQSKIDNNPYGGIYNDTATMINAENNYWGSLSGPYHSSNILGTGNPVTDYVDFIPYLTSWP